MIANLSLRSVAFLSVFFWLTSCGGKSQGPPGLGPGGPAPYQVAPVYYGQTMIEYSFPVTVEGEQNVEIRPKVDGFIETIFVDEGAIVQRGQPLFRLHNPQYEQAVRSAAAAVQVAEADVHSAVMDVDKVQPLVQQAIISTYELQSRQYSLQSKQAALASARANLTNAKVNQSYTYITSPSDGMIGSIPYKRGSLVSSASGSPLTTVYNTKNFYTYFSVNEKQLLALSRQVKGTTLQSRLATMLDVKLVLADGTEYEQKGRITTATGLINTATGSANFRATFPNTQGLIRSGSSGTIKIPVAVDNAVLVPQSATFDQQGAKFVYKLIGSDSISITPIEVDEVGVGNLYIVRKGLAQGDQVVIEGAGSIRPGTKISPVPAKHDSVYALAMQL